MHYYVENPSGSNAKWVIDYLEDYDYCRIAHVFKFEQDEQTQNEYTDDYHFKVGKLLD